MDRLLETQIISGEIGLVIDYAQGKAVAVDVLQAAMGMIEALDRLDTVLLSSVDTALEPISVLNDVQHSSLRMLLARASNKVPDELIKNLEWEKWVGALLVTGKYKLLQKIDADASQIQQVLIELEPDYRAAPTNLVGYNPPIVSDVREALDAVSKARSALPSQRVTVQTDMGDVILPEVMPPITHPVVATQAVTNRGTEFFKVKSPDMLGSAQWVVLRNGRSIKVTIEHQSWLDAYHRREHALQPGDSLRCRFEETVSYDDSGNEVDRKLSIIEVQSIMSPPPPTEQRSLGL